MKDWQILQLWADISSPTVDTSLLWGADLSQRERRNVHDLNETIKWQELQVAKSGQSWGGKERLVGSTGQNQWRKILRLRE